MNLFVSCEKYDYSKLGNLSFLKLGKFYCEYIINLPFNIKLKVIDQNTFYTNINKLLISPGFVKSPKQYNQEIKKEMFVSDLIGKNFRNAYQYVLKNYENIVQYSIYFYK